MSKKKTPTYKEYSGETIEKLTLTRETSKRALFKSPLEKLFCNNNSKRIRSEESIENLNCENKIRLIDISQSNNINSSSRNEGHVKKRLFSGSQSDLMLPQPSTKAAVKQPMTTDIKRVC